MIRLNLCRCGNYALRGSELCLTCRNEEAEKSVKKSQTQKQYETQAAFFALVRNKLPQLKKLIFALPVTTAKSTIGKRNQRNYGVVGGVAGILCLMPSGGYNYLCLDCVTEGQKPTKDQLGFRLQAEQAGGRYATFSNPHEGLRIVQEYISHTKL
ncbi:MAG: hypothetical protein ACLVKO_09090 [Dysgonomonas sp.]